MIGVYWQILLSRFSLGFKLGLLRKKYFCCKKKSGTASCVLVFCMTAIQTNAAPTFGLFYFNQHFYTDETLIRQSLGRNPPEVKVTNEQKLCSKVIYIVSQTSV